LQQDDLSRPVEREAWFGDIGHGERHGVGTEVGASEAGLGQGPAGNAAVVAAAVVDLRRSDRNLAGGVQSDRDVPGQGDGRFAILNRDVELGGALVAKRVNGHAGHGGCADRERSPRRRRAEHGDFRSCIDGQPGERRDGSDRFRSAVINLIEAAQRDAHRHLGNSQCARGGADVIQVKRGRNDRVSAGRCRRSRGTVVGEVNGQPARCGCRGRGLGGSVIDVCEVVQSERGGGRRGPKLTVTQERRSLRQNRCYPLAHYLWFLMLYVLWCTTAR